MNIKALITAALVIGSTSLAMADNDDMVRDHRYEPVAAQTAPAPEIRDHRYEPVVETAPAPAPAPVVASWGHPPIYSVLSMNDSIGRYGRTTIRLNAWKPIQTLKLQGTKGTTNIDMVTIKFANGRTQTVDLDKSLSAGGCAEIDLQGSFRKVVSLTVTGSSSRRASFEVLGA
jgi:hypothetical protein